jgi:pimeloyl-ACP methyl ester carboxylesterase
VQLHGCTAPMLVVSAERDIFGGRAATAERACQVLPNCTAVVVPGARHVLSRARFVGVIERTLEFFRRHCPLSNSVSS